MRRSRQRKRIINLRQSGGWNAGASSVPSYESFTMFPTPRGFPANEAPGDTVDMSLTGGKRPASDAEHVQESTSSEALLQPAPVERGHSESDIGSQHSPVLLSVHHSSILRDLFFPCFDHCVVFSRLFIFYLSSLNVNDCGRIFLRIQLPSINCGKILRHSIFAFMLREDWLL